MGTILIALLMTHAKRAKKAGFNNFFVAKFFINVSIIVGYTCVLIGAAFLVVFY
mgnify:FL=1